MKTTMAAIDEVYTLLTTGGSPVSTGLSGKVYKHQRPLGSDKQDVVVNAVTISGDQLQQCPMNINIHVPDIPVTIDDKAQGVINRSMLEKLTTRVIENVNDVYKNDFGIYVEFVSDPIAEGEISAHYVNVRIRFTFEPS